MLGYDISWAAFNIIEVMSSTKFTYKVLNYFSQKQTITDINGEFSFYLIQIAENRLFGRVSSIPLRNRCSHANDESATKRFGQSEYVRSWYSHQWSRLLHYSRFSARFGQRDYETSTIYIILYYISLIM